MNETCRVPSFGHFDFPSFDDNLDRISHREGAEFSLPRCGGAEINVTKCFLYDYLFHSRF